MAVNDDARFGDFFFVSSSSSHSINGPDPPAKTTTAIGTAASDEDDDDWGDFVISSNNISRTESIPVDNRLNFDPFPKSPIPSQPESAPSRVESMKNKPAGALPLSIFGEEEKEDEGSGAVDAEFNGVIGLHSYSKKDGNLKANGSDLNALLGDLYKQNVKGNEANGIWSRVDVNKLNDLNSKVDTWNWNGSNSSLNGSNLNVDAFDFSGNGIALVKKEENLGSRGYASGMDIKEGYLGLSGFDFGSNGSGLGSNLELNVGNSDLVNEDDDDDDDDGWEFRGAEPKAEAAVQDMKSNPYETMSNFNMSTLSWDPLGTIANGLSSNINGVNSNGSKVNSNLVDENDKFSDDDDDDDGWEFKAAEPEPHVGTGNAKVLEVQEQENPKGVEFGFGFVNGVNGSSEFFGTSDGISKKTGEWNLGFGFPASFESQSNHNGTTNCENSSSVGKNIGSGEMSWAFKDATYENGLMAKEEPKVADASSSGVEDLSFRSHNQGKEETLKKPNGALPLSIFGDTEIETEDPLRDEDISILKPTTPWTGMKDTRSNISINDLISSLYSQAEITSSLSQISNPSENGLLSSHIEAGSNLVDDDSNLDDDSWEFKGAVSGTRGENQNSPLDFGDSYENYSTKTELNDFVDLYSKLTPELCFVALSHLDNFKKDKSIAAPSAEDAEVKAIEEEVQGLYNELQKDGIIFDEVASENLQSRSIYLGEYAKVLREKRFQVLESEYQLSEKLLLAEKDMEAAIELLKHAASTLKILKLGSVDDQSNYVSAWSRILSVCAIELKLGATIWKQSLQKNIHSQLLSKPQGRQYILALGEIYRIVKIVGSLSTELYKPWILFSSENPTNFLALVRECHTVWSSACLEEALQSLTDSTDLNYDVEALLGSIQSIHDPDVHELYKQVFYGQEPTCCLTGLNAVAVPGMKVVLWDGRYYFLTVVNLWANLVSRDPLNLPYIHVRK